MRIKFTLFTLLMCGLVINQLNAQLQPQQDYATQDRVIPRDDCRSNAGQAAVAYERNVDRAEYKRQMRKYLQKAERGAVVQYAVQLHIITRDDGTGGIDVEDIRGEIENFVNPYFADIDIEFVECSPEQYHASTEYYVLGNGGEDPDVAGDQMSVDFNVPDVINLYFVSDPDGACGWARFPWKLPSDYIVMANSCADNQSTLVHELGHYFGLYHTHSKTHGAESVTRDDTDGCWDCETDGDMLCDTPADPNLSSTANDWPSCVYTGTETDDCNGDAYVPMIDNIMSYADKECRVVFTPEQLARMEVFRDGDRSYLQTGCPCEKPEAICMDITISLDDAGNASLSPDDIDNGSTWDCGLDSWSVSTTAFDCGDVGANVVTLTVIDDLGWESTCDATVTVEDNTDPVMDVGARNETVGCDGAGNGAAFAAWLADNGGASASDACGGSWSNNSSGLSDGCGATGSETVTFTYTDPSGNSASTMSTFTIEDNTDPSLTCPDDIHLPECVPTAIWEVEASDVCGDVTIVSVPPSGSTFAKGTTTIVTVTVTDECGNTNECTFEVTRDPDLEVSIDPPATSPLNTCAAGTGANIVLGYGGGPTCATLHAVGAGGHGPYTYSWEGPTGLPDGIFEDDDTDSPTFCADFQTEPCVTYVFEVTVTDIHGCTETEQVEINVVNPLCSEGNNPKVSVCHRPPGDPENEHTACIGTKAVSQHLNLHDDCLGSCDDVCVLYSPEAPYALPGQTEYDLDRFDASGIVVQPNPFSTSTLVKFSLDEDTSARLTVFDVSGKAVGILHDGPVVKGQQYSVEFAAADLQPGMYIARLISDNGDMQIAKMVLVR